MFRLIPIPTNVISNISSILFSGEPYKQLGRWCHPGIPNCTQDVLLRKIDFANSDNNLCNKNSSTFITTKIQVDKVELNEKVETNTFTPQEYIDAMHN